ncbi:lytic murein transglycosylase [Epibacterium ulvae]|uniref:lytic murein transglycosylase n=1 Tax=Epibacterium ulvae TaxID=1156985 RepID=UPI001BFC11EA|nr:lytic murein transglycosylase [Epibacterium ulvae]MBT8153215.1 lytic murein transglycosylase [Epibacterium ulvae]
MMKLVSTTAILIALGTSGMASPEISLRPLSRPVSSDNVVLSSVEALRPTARSTVDLTQTATPAAANAGFQNWIGGFQRRAQNQGISKRTLNRAFSGISYDTEVIRRDRNQSEFTKTIWEYLDSAASDSRIKNGKAALREHRRTLERIEAHYGVPKEVVTAVWGLESAYGTYKGSMDIVQSLATLAYDGRRGRFFEAQLIAALKILQAGDVAPRKMTGSWAGAMGHTQFIPTSYLAYAVDFTGDGKRDIWSEDPTDALASTAAYLAKFGWVKGQPWGVEVQLPRNFNFSLANRKIKKSPADWAKLGVKGVDGRNVPNYGSASILLPAGGQGAAFMIFKNFSVIERYNAADAYVIGVGHLSDRINGAGPIKANWPRGDRALSFKERQEMQRLLTRAGFSTQGVDGKIGPNTIAAVRAFQASQGLVQDGYPSLSLLKRLQ